MIDNKTLILEEFEQLKGQFVISGYDVKRLIAIGQDELDYYYVLWDGRKAVWSTCVGRIIPLKGYIPEDDYKSLIFIAKLNDFSQPTFFNNKRPEIEEFNKKVKSEVEDIKEPNKFLTEVFWDII